MLSIPMNYFIAGSTSH
jgi:hypothetical protein